MTHRLLPALLVSLSLLGGCSGASEPAALAAAEPIADGEVCHVCGMVIEAFPGPKGQVFLERQGTPRKFCSTLDMFVFLRQPENETQLSHAYVHDVGKTTWASPDDEAFILASEAWYVVGHDRRGGMGHTLASFGEHEQAEAFRDSHGGNVLAYEEIDLALLGELGRADPPSGTAHGHGHAQQ
ncbi:nitrous oxide reductase accessory protein NosL [Litchfieldella xinjiangensis]|uniref:nitrous oxide reductase accessory protein NosL n=1 Tax=Litchfieldella xinjiangensis TaxID=1166948 RepID=UPI0005BA9E41|nr:nitrous oxide reductase accessory protein NosL [Halomonas xinjiangensis]